jgi:autotransporter-associated beta strand protein
MRPQEISNHAFSSRLPTRKSAYLMLAGAALVFAPKVHNASAAPFTWTGLNDQNWATSGNWSTGGASASLTTGQNLAYAGTTAPATSNNNFTAGDTWATIAFNSGAASYTLTGNGIGLNASSATTVINNGSALQTIDLPLTMTSGGRTIEAAAGNIVIADGLAGTAGEFFGQNPTFTGTNAAPVATGVVVLDSVATYTQSSTVTNATNIDSSTLQIGAGGSLTFATSFTGALEGYVVLGNSSLETSGVLELGDSTAPVNQTVNSIATSGTGTSNAVIGGNSGISTLNIDYLNPAKIDTIAATLGGSGTNQNNLALDINSGVGATCTVTLTASNTYVGNTTIAAGTLALGANGSITKSPLIIVGLTAASPATFNVSAVSGGFSLANGQALEGGGTVVGALNVANGSTLSPGNSPGTLTDNGNVTYSGGGSYLWQINEADGTQGADPGWDLHSITGTLNIAATSATLFNIDITSLTLADIAGPTADFNPESDYTWTIATASGGITNFSASDFNLDTTGFANSTAGSVQNGSFSITTSGNNLELVYTGAVVPEPTTVAGALALGAVGLLARRRRAERT